MLYFLICSAREEYCHRFDVSPKYIPLGLVTCVEAAIYAQFPQSPVRFSLKKWSQRVMSQQACTQLCMALSASMDRQEARLQV